MYLDRDVEIESECPERVGGGSFNQAYNVKISRIMGASKEAILRVSNHNNYRNLIKQINDEGLKAI